MNKSPDCACFIVCFLKLGAELVVINDRPDGYNINLNCGALYPESLGQTVVKEKADIGIALDGDADRLVVCDENGSVVDGDQLIATIAVLLLNQKKLKLYMERKASCDHPILPPQNLSNQEKYWFL